VKYLNPNSKYATLLIGDIVIDRYKYKKSHFFRIGCSGNVLRALDYMSIPTIFLSSFPKGKIVEGLIHKHNKNIIHCEIYNSIGEMNIIEYEIKDGKVVQLLDNPALQFNLHDLAMSKVIEECNVKSVIISDYGLGTIGPLSKVALRKKATQSDVTLCVDCRLSNFNDYDGSSWFFPTEMELAQYLNTQDRNKYSPFKSLLNELNATGIILKKSEKGLVKITRDQITIFPAMPLSGIADQYGAGDMLIGLFSTILGDSKSSDRELNHAMSVLNNFLNVPGGNGLIAKGSSEQLQTAIELQKSPYNHSLNTDSLKLAG
jgi:bifunctional ADP-heptose synthase (sugar kinase/adenylyltransferase)